MQVLELEATSTIMALDWDYQPPCDGRTHHLGQNGHKADEPAAWLMTMPCCGPKILVCDSRRAQILSQNGVRCSAHDRSATAEEIGFTRIE